jgi:hypothetical protein
VEPHSEQGTCSRPSFDARAVALTFCDGNMQCDELVAEGAIAERTPAELVQKCDITFAMLSDPAAALQVSGFCIRGMRITRLASPGSSQQHALQ